MIYNLLIGGAAGQGMETLASMLEKENRKWIYDSYGEYRSEEE